MPKLIKNIQGSVVEMINGDITSLNPIIGNVASGDYINLAMFKAYIQNFDKVESSESLQKPLLFGLKNNTIETVLEISY